MHETNDRKTKFRKCARIAFVALVVGAALWTVHLVTEVSSRPARAWECEGAGGLAQAGTILVSPTMSTMGVGESVTVTVWLSDVADYYGLDFHLQFDPSVVTATRIAPRWDLFDAGYNYLITDVLSDEVHYVVSNMNPADPFTGTGQVCAIVFEALAPVTSTLHFDYALGATRDGDSLSPTKEHGEIEVDIGVTSTDIPLAVGWNLVSVPLIPSSTAITEVLSSIEGDYDLVYAYDSADESDPWKKYDVDMPSFLNDLYDIDETIGFWIHVTDNVSLTINGLKPTATGIDLFTGWNLVGYPSESTRVLTETLQSIDGKYNLVYAYYAMDATDPWKKYDVDMPAFLNDLNVMEPGHGYWIQTTEDCFLAIDYE